MSTEFLPFLINKRAARGHEQDHGFYGFAPFYLALRISILSFQIPNLTLLNSILTIVDYHCLYVSILEYINNNKETESVNLKSYI